MRYKLTGFVAWHGARLYLRSRLGETAKRAGAAAVVGAGIGLAVLAQRQAAAD
jgi:hypothetical protein